LRGVSKRFKKVDKLCKIAFGFDVVPDENKINPGSPISLNFLIKV